MMIKTPFLIVQEAIGFVFLLSIIAVWTAMTLVLSMGRAFIPFGIVNPSHYSRKRD